MVTIPIKSQRLSTSDDDGGDDHVGWGTLQIATPVIVAGVLLLVFVAYFIWQRRPTRRRSYDYRQVRSDLAITMERMFARRKRVHPSSVAITLDDSMRSSAIMPQNRRSYLIRSDSSDSQTPLTSASYAFDYPPSKRLSESPPPISVPQRRGLRWWWLFGSRPQEIKSEEPGTQWCVDASDGSTAGHGRSNHGHEEHTGHQVRALEDVQEVREEETDSVIRIGESFTTVESTPLTQYFHEQERNRGMSPVPEHPVSSGARTPQQATRILRSLPGTPVPRANRDLPPSYDVSQSRTHYTSTEDMNLPSRSHPYMAMPAPVRTAGYSSTRTFHVRELSSDSILASQSPMVAPSLY